MKKYVSLISLLLIVSFTLSSCAGKGFRAVAVTDGVDVSDASFVVGVPDALEGYFNKATEYMLLDDTDNVAFSPIGAYTVLAMIAECAKNDSRDQIVSALGGLSVEQLRECAKNLLYSVSTNCDSANSVWLSDNNRYNKNTLENLTDSFGASVYEGVYNSPDALEQIKKWMKDNSFDSLDNLIDNFSLYPNSSVLLLNALNLKAEWEVPFDPERNRTDTFYTNGGEVSAEYMTSALSADIKSTDDFNTVALNLKNGGKMVLLLPNQDKTLTSVLKTEDAMNALSKATFYDGQQSCVVKVPKFDITQRNDLRDMAKSLGITAVFSDGGEADLTSLSKDLDTSYIASFSQMINVKINEKGVEASAITEAMESYKSAPDLNFEFNRPFAFSVFTKSGVPVFVGTVNNPS